MSSVTDSVGIGARTAHAQLGECITGFEVAIVDLEQRAATAEREAEEALQEAGRLRARVEALEAAGRTIVELYVEAGLDDTHPVWPLRVALGLDGATGARDVNAEVPQ